MQKGFFQMERYNATVIQLDFLGILVYNASMPNKEMRFFGGQLGVSRLHLTPKVTPTYACQNS